MMFLEERAWRGDRKSTRGWDRLEHPLEKTGAMCEKHMENMEKTYGKYGKQMEHIPNKVGKYGIIISFGYHRT